MLRTFDWLQVDARARDNRGLIPLYLKVILELDPNASHRTQDLFGRPEESLVYPAFFEIYNCNMWVDASKENVSEGANLKELGSNPSHFIY